MYEQKTKEHEGSVIEFIESIEKPSKKEDAYRLLEIFEQATGHPAKMWGDSIIGFGSYHYRYATGHEGDAPLAGFSPRKAKISLYLTGCAEKEPDALERLGKCTAGKSCIYINKLSDIDPEVLKELIQNAAAYLQERYPDKG
ncbi:DUF1801 domain-containing protein [Planococcus alpniumensis]|uniref:DUF1801 domain-containing protein n=1 Tax=Planococcus alpniumensis TaxID=2708345 RepID=UPI001B8B9546|nr:DUF1801 domain-containing protein [Planococcus sp. MSAK28401]